MLSLRSFRAFLLWHEQIGKVCVENPSRVSLIQSSVTCLEYSKSLIVPRSRDGQSKGWESHFFQPGCRAEFCAHKISASAAQCWEGEVSMEEMFSLGWVICWEWKKQGERAFPCLFSLYFVCLPVVKCPVCGTAVSCPLETLAGNHKLLPKETKQQLLPLGRSHLSQHWGILWSFPVSECPTVIMGCWYRRNRGVVQI